MSSSLFVLLAATLAGAACGGNFVVGTDGGARNGENTDVLAPPDVSIEESAVEAEAPADEAPTIVQGDDAGNDAAFADGAGDDTLADALETGTCAFSPAPPAAVPLPDTSAPEQAQAEARELVALDALVGRFLRGDVVVYRGSLDAESTDVHFETKTTASLEVASPCALTWDEFAVLDTATGPNERASDNGLRSFVPEGDEMVAHHQGSYGAPRVRGQCAIVTSYAIDVWIKRANLASAGTRNYHVTDSTYVCKP